jgi:hypothetical protein
MLPHFERAADAQVAAPTPTHRTRSNSTHVPHVYSCSVPIVPVHSCKIHGALLCFRSTHAFPLCARSTHSCSAHTRRPLHALVRTCASITARTAMCSRCGALCVGETSTHRVCRWRSCARGRRREGGHLVWPPMGVQAGATTPLPGTSPHPRRCLHHPHTHARHGSHTHASPPAVHAHAAQGTAVLGACSAHTRHHPHVLVRTCASITARTAMCSRCGALRVGETSTHRVCVQVEELRARKEEGGGTLSLAPDGGAGRRHSPTPGHLPAPTPSLAPPTHPRAARLTHARLTACCACTRRAGRSGAGRVQCTHMSPLTRARAHLS